MAYTKISYELKGDIAIISFNDPSTLNACGVDTAQELLHAFEIAADEARCTILTAAPISQRPTTQKARAARIVAPKVVAYSMTLFISIFILSAETTLRGLSSMVQFL